MPEYAIIFLDQDSRAVELINGGAAARPVAKWTLVKRGYTVRSTAEKHRRDYVRGAVEAGGKAEEWKVVEFKEAKGK